MIRRETMRYLLATSKYEEIPSRCDYLHDVFGFYFCPNTISDGFISLTPLGVCEVPFLFIVGHYTQVENYLKQNSDNISEKYIILITCFADKLKKYKSKNIVFYSSYDINGLSYLYPGVEYGFQFNITESELKYYSSKTPNMILRLDSAFHRLC